MLKILHNLHQLQCKYKEKQFTLSSDTRFLDFGSSKVTTGFTVVILRNNYVTPQILKVKISLKEIWYLFRKEINFKTKRFILKNYESKNFQLFMIFT